MKKEELSEGVKKGTVALEKVNAALDKTKEDLEKYCAELDKQVNDWKEGTRNAEAILKKIDAVLNPKNKEDS